MKRRLIALALSLGVTGLAVAQVLPESKAAPALASLKLTTTPLPLDPADPAVDRIGGLRFMGAVQIRSADPLFGGISGLRSGRGSRMLAETDTGNWIAFDTVERNGRLIGVANGVIAPILRPDGQRAVDKKDGDAESLEFDPATGATMLSYEQRHRIEHFAGLDPARPETLRLRPVSTETLDGTANWRANGGGEALAVLPGGARVLICEDGDDGGRHEALLTVGGVTRAFGVTAPQGFAPTDAVALDSHRLLILNRRFNPADQQAAVTLADLAPVLAGGGGVVEPALVARWAVPLTVDNMEGLALRRQGGRVFLYVVSDDNQNSLERTLLMKFELTGPLATPSSR